MAANPVVPPYPLNSGSDDIDMFATIDNDQHAANLVKKCLAFVDERIEKTGSARDSQSQPVEGGSGIGGEDLDEREAAAKVEFRRASLWLDKVLGPLRGDHYKERALMNEYGVGFHLLEQIQQENDVPDEEMRTRNLVLSKLEKKILDEVPRAGPFKDALDAKMAKLHHELRRALPASLLLDMEGHPGFSGWITNLDIGGEDRYIAVRTFFLDLRLDSW